MMPGLDEEPSFQADFAARLHGTPFYAWVNLKDSINLLAKFQGTDGDDPKAAGPDSPLTALGLTSLTSASFSYRNLPEGLAAQFFVGVPEGKRRGLIKALAAENKESGPSSFVPADAVEILALAVELSAKLGRAGKNAQ